MLDLTHFTPWTLFTDLGFVSILLLIGKIIRVKVKLIQQLFIPPSLIAGLLGLTFGPNGLGWIPLSSEIGTYAAILIALVFGALPLSSPNVSMKEITERVGPMWAFAQIGMLLQWGCMGLFGLFVIKLIWPDLNDAFGIMLSTGFYGGHGTAAAIGFHSMRRKPRHLLMTINNIPMTNADIITGVSLMLLFVFTGNLLGFSLGFGTLLVAHITFNIPYVVLAVLPKLRQLNPNLGEAAMDLGATPWQAFWKVLMPELRPGILNGLLIAFTLSIDDFVISYFTAGSEVSTLAMQIYAMTRKRISPEINALSTILFVTVLGLLLIVNLREMRQSKLEEKRKKALQRDGMKGGSL